MSKVHTVCHMSHYTMAIYTLQEFKDDFTTGNDQLIINN